MHTSGVAGLQVVSLPYGSHQVFEAYRSLMGAEGKLATS